MTSAKERDLKRLVLKTFLRLGGDRLAWRWNRRSLRILCYHGVCEDRLASQPWMPGFFVAASAFRRQLSYLKANATIVPLSEGVLAMQNGTLPPRAVSITFDDGYANNLHLAGPLLSEYQLPATIFLSSAYMASGELFPFLKVKLIHLKLGSNLAQRPLLEYKTSPLDEVLERANWWWPEIQRNLSEDQINSLRPLTVSEVRAFDSGLIELGAHSHTHCILKNESRERRDEEIRKSTAKVAEWTGRPTRLFSYPNGQRDDFGALDKEVLRSIGIRAAVSGMGGTNKTASDLFELRRYPVGLYHDQDAFCAEITGFRTAWRSIAGGLG